MEERMGKQGQDRLTQNFNERQLCPFIMKNTKINIYIIQEMHSEGNDTSGHNMTLTKFWNFHLAQWCFSVQITAQYY